MTTPGAQVRRRKPPRRAEVVSVERITPRLVSVKVGGEAMSAFRIEAPTSHIKVFLPAGGQTTLVLPEYSPDGPVWPEAGERPSVRTYTPRRFDETSQTLEVQFVLHGAGPASEWAERAKPGDQLAIGGPGGRFSLDQSIERWWIAGDESAIPAVGTLLDALPASAIADVHLEVAGPDDEIELPTAAKATVGWHKRREPDAWGEELYEAATAGPDPEAKVWVACEAAAMRRIRRYLVAERNLPARELVTRGYWRLGAANHPDHDYGDDDLG
ncbi:MAG TPA: siderophore-interacting protein [Streptosporangiaceae bacterium]